MKLDRLTNQVYFVALNEARLQNHEFITPEHILYAALMFDMGKRIVDGSGGRTVIIVSELQDFFERSIPKYPTDATGDKTAAKEPVNSYSLIQLFEMASNQAENASKDTVCLSDIIVSMFNLRESHCVYIMQKNGVNKIDLLRFVSHEVKNDTPEQVEKRIVGDYTMNLTQRAKDGLLDPVIGREAEMDRAVHILCRRQKNNVIFIGDPGVGKSALANSLAQRVVSGMVPSQLRNAQIYFMDMGTVLSGTKYRGDFEDRMISILDKISKEENPIIYFDELHTIVGTGAISQNGMDAAALLKPYFINSRIRFIGSTTYEDYKKVLEKEKALIRRFQKIDVGEPAADECVNILKGLKHKYEEFHRVMFNDETVEQICKLAVKSLHDRFMPDKAIDVMDEAAAYVRLRHDLSIKDNVDESNDHSQEKIDGIIEVKIDDIEFIIASMAKAPKESISADETKSLLELDKHLKSRIFGQDQAIDALVDSIKLSRAGLSEAGKPVASLLFVGPTGVGKTELAVQTAEALNIKLIRYDMSEYQEKHTVSRLIGSPPGYVGFDEGGLLTEAIRKTPYAVLLLDEIEKAHQDVLNVLLSIMDYGSLTDNIGKKADFCNVILIMTSNAGARDMNKRIVGFEGNKYEEEAIDREVERVFSPEFRNRLDAIVKFNHINEEMAKSIASKAIAQIGVKMTAKGVDLSITDAALMTIAEKGLLQTYGAREIIRTVNTEIKKLLADKILFGADGNKSITVGVDNGQFVLM